MLSLARSVSVLDYLPPIFHEVKEMIEIAKVENPVLEALWQEIENGLLDQFLLSATNRGIKRYEDMLHMNVMATDDLETRRFRLLTRYNEQVPYTRSVLRNLLNSLLGDEGYELTINGADKTLKVKIELTVKGMFDAVGEMLGRIVPQNMVITVELRYNQHSTLARYTHAQLAAYTHDQLRSEVLS
ncbi:putative phage tail protein [Paenibacillus sp. FA6]|uniref:putative phage tail protein n=1 Tax=Paenibacillus sp. FA6 TaxID=3413029 RepID=UPI003F65A187